MNPPATPLSREREMLAYEGRKLDDYLKHLRNVAMSCGVFNRDAEDHVEAAIKLLAENLADLEERFLELIERESEDSGDRQSRAA